MQQVFISGINLRRHSLKCLRKYPHPRKNKKKDRTIKEIVSTNKRRDDNVSKPQWHIPEETNSIVNKTWETYKLKIANYNNNTHTTYQNIEGRQTPNEKDNNTEKRMKNKQTKVPNVFNA